MITAHTLITRKLLILTYVIYVIHVICVCIRMRARRREKLSDPLRLRLHRLQAQGLTARLHLAQGLI